MWMTTSTIVVVVVASVGLELVVATVDVETWVRFVMGVVERIAWTVVVVVAVLVVVVVVVVVVVEVLVVVVVVVVVVVSEHRRSGPQDVWRASV